MKKFFLILVFLMFNLSTYAQSHIEFKGIPLTGHIDGFMQKMQNEGFLLVEKYDKSVVWYKGKFAGLDADIVVFTTPSTQTVYEVCVCSEHDSWYDLKKSYFDYKKMYENKYGKPFAEKETFHSPYCEGDGYELTALRDNKCEYSSSYELNGGIVTVSLEVQHGNVVLQLCYIDEIGYKLREMEKMNDI